VRAVFFDDAAAARSTADWAPRFRRLEDTITLVWRVLDLTSARRFVRQVRPVVRRAAEHERRSLRVAPMPPAAVDPTVFYGDWAATLKLGAGGDGDAFGATHVPSGTAATLKTPPGAEGYVWQHLADDWHPRLVRIFEYGRPSPLGGAPWIVRAYADTSLWDTWLARGGLARDEVLEIFGVACEVVAWLHQRGVFRWSAHMKNILRVDGQWQVADLGRCLILVDADHWATARVRDEMQHAWLPMRCWTAELPSSWWRFVDALRWASFWSHRTNGFWPHQPELEERLRLDDCATLGGLLCQLLVGTRFDHFLKALEVPLCSATYTLTGDEDVDRGLSQVLNRAWLGDGGGALAVAAARQDGYTNPHALLGDVQAVLG
jgi:hypothetical protein